MQALDNTIANVALPRIQGSLSATQDQMTWVLTSYIVAAAIMTPLSGWLAGRFGRKRVFLFRSSASRSPRRCAAWRNRCRRSCSRGALQGLCGAALIPMSQAVLLDINPPEHHGRAMAIWVMGVTIGPILGPALGGWLTENYSWRWVFYINVPFGILCVRSACSHSCRKRRMRRSRFDFFGFATLSLAIGALQLMLDRGQRKDWFSSARDLDRGGDRGAVRSICSSCTCSRRASAPFISLALFKDRNFVTGNFFIFVVGVVLFATLALLPPLLQDLIGYPVVLTGLVTAPRGTRHAGRDADRRSADGPHRHARCIIAAGFALTAMSLWQMTHFYLQMDSVGVVWSGVLQGLGTGFVFVPLSAITFATLAPQLRNEGTAVFSLMRNIGSSIGISAWSHAADAQYADHARAPRRAHHALRRRPRSRGSRGGTGRRVAGSPASMPR